MLPVSLIADIKHEAIVRGVNYSKLVERILSRHIPRQHPQSEEAAAP